MSKIKKPFVRPKISSTNKTQETDIEAISQSECTADDVFTVRSVSLVKSTASSLDGSTHSSEKTRASSVKAAKWKTLKSEVSKGSHYLRTKLTPARKRNVVKEICIPPPSPTECWTPEGLVHDDGLILASRENSAASSKTTSTSSTTDSALIIYDAELDGEL